MATTGRRRWSTAVMVMAVCGMVLAAGGLAAPAAGAGPTGRAITCLGLEATRVGTAGADTINGTPGDDVLVGLGGNDTIYGGDGANIMWGDPGNDRLVGGADFDTAYGGPGNDVLDSGDGVKSRLYGQGGRDRILLRRVRGGDDQLVDGGAGQDILDLRAVTVVPLASVNLFVYLDSAPPNLVGPRPGETGLAYVTAGSVIGIESVFGSSG